MSLAAACGWTLLRSAIVAAAGVPICWCLRRQLAALAPRPRLLLWMLLLIPFFTPAILTGYGWSSFALSLVRHPFWNEVLYATLLALRFVPAGLVLMWLAPPPPLTAEALHTARLASVRHGRLARGIWLSPFVWRGPLRDALPAAAVIFLLAFQEFETASLMGVASWMVWLFDAQAGGLVLSETLRRALWPLACEAAVLALLVTFAVRGRLLIGAPERKAVALSAGPQAAAWLFALSASVAVAGVPLVLIGGDLSEGLGVVLRSRRVIEEIGVALAFGGISGGAAAVLVAALLHRNGGQRMPRVARAAGVALLLPGLLGSLAVSLGVLWLFQREPFHAAYDSPLPVLVALGAFLLPRAAVLFLLVAAATPRHGLHAARLLAAASDSGRQRAARWLTWQLSIRRYVLAAGVVSVWGYLELLPASILSPAGTRSAVVRLYEDMHYGRNAVLSSTALLVIVAPGLLWLVLASLVAGATWCLGRFRGR